MTRYIISRFVQAAIVIALVTLVVFWIMRTLPGDSVDAMIMESAADANFDDEALRESLGLNDPFLVQYSRWAKGALQGDLGRSTRSGIPVAAAIKERFPATVQLAVVSMIVGLSLGVALGVVAAMKPNTPIDLVITVAAMGGVAVPTFLSSIILIWIFTVELQWLPSVSSRLLWDDPVGASKALVMPVIALSLTIAAPIMRHTRSSVMEVLRHDYVRTAHAKGLSNSTVVVRHALRNGLLPVVTVAGLRVGSLLEGSVIIESMFSVPGVARLAVTSIATRDYPMLQGIVILFAVIAVGMSLIVDMIYLKLDPTIKYS